MCRLGRKAWLACNCAPQRMHSVENSLFQEVSASNSTSTVTMGEPNTKKHKGKKTFTEVAAENARKRQKAAEDSGQASKSAIVTVCVLNLLLAW